MTGDKQLDYLIGVLYETVLDPRRWSEAVGLCGQYAGGIDGHLTTFAKKNTPIGCIVGLRDFSSSQRRADFMNYYSGIDPRLRLLREKPIQEWSCCHHYFNQSYVDKNEFYQDFYIGEGFRYAMSALVDSDEYDHYLVSVREVGQQPFGNAEQLAAQRFSGHLQRALRLQKQTQNLHDKIELGAMAINALALSMLIVDGKGAIRHMNAGAERLLSNRFSGLTGNAGRLSAADPGHKNKLAALIVDATDYPAVGGAMFLSGEQARQIFITPLPAASPFAKDWQTPLALVLAIEPGNTLSTLQLLGKLYNLTSAELRVASAILAGSSPEEYGQQAGVTQNTVRSQLKSLFRKTGTRRQSELVAVLSRVPTLQD